MHKVKIQGHKKCLPAYSKNPQRWLLSYHAAKKTDVCLRVFAKHIVVLILVGGAIKLSAQDIHFSLYEETGQIINPGLTGMLQGDLRVSTNFRSQWASMGTPFKTFAAAMDTRLDLKSNSSLGVGFHAYKDLAGSTRMGTTDIGLNVAGIINLSKHQLISVGLAGGILQRSIDPSTFRWQNQYKDGAYDPANPADEKMNTELALNFNASAGITWQYYSKSRNMVSNDQLRATAGFAYHHVNRPKINFLENNSQRLYPKLVFHGTMLMGLQNTNMAIVPSTFFSAQGPSKEILVGSMLRMLVQHESKYTHITKEMAYSIGVYYRVGDAIIPAILVEFSNFKIGASYDVTLSSLRKANGYRGGMEFSFAYVTPNPFAIKKGVDKKRYTF